MSSEIVDVIVVGCGPVGAITANFLGQQGLRTMLLEKDLTTHSQPRAFSCDDETQRNFRIAGLEGELAITLWDCKSMDYIDAKKQVLGSAVFSELDFGNGHHGLSFFNQPQMEHVMREGLKRFPHVELRLGHEVESLTQDAEGVTLQVKDRRTGRSRELRARYVLGADGSHSTIRRLMGSTLAGTSYEEPWIAISGTTPTAEPDFTYYVCDPARPGFVTRGPFNEIRMDLLLHENERTEVMESPELVNKLMSPFVDPKLMKLQRASVFTFQAKVATRWREGRVFILGDAAHVMPPFMGQGLCSGIRDALNLTWKLALVVRGAAGDSLLDTYEAERRPHATNMIKATIMMGKVFLARSKFIAAVRNFFLRWSYNNPKTRSFIREFKARPPIRLPNGFISGGKYKEGSAEGTYFPQPRVGLPGGETVLLDTALGCRFAVLCLASVTEPVLGSAEAFARELNGVLVRVLPADRASEARPGDVVDVEGKLAAWFARFKSDTAVVRPDRYVYGTSSGSGIEKLREQVRPFIHQASAPRATQEPARALRISNA
ncbi:bifunctional 3-(3-hydroxy-phenyl)propionate/3-hydroxycinnamic acid hydroxylase MhpA [Hyalangium gracile]|uniref:bifunctional 3-(3-hydroxy-phenyl)propionate/3-hydroxycinnamic acid hydroxylase MhpA n=1 Tax=Hyalangium gracile TaxID=394092 RepID=UPI001CCFA1FE|nr:bifunctional 3-(3-hydroxy-phenyl)propionate/3-hydroxycinnamic acid hydroxylase [Hyalangium gracile]